MKTTIPLLGFLGAAAALALSGCASVPEEGSLVYYDAGSIWCWQDGIGWNYLGERQVRIARNHIPAPVLHHPGEPVHVPPSGHHPPPTPGQPLPSG